jgi:hypothetical protein
MKPDQLKEHSMNDLNRFLVGGHNANRRWWLYRFPNGREVSVIIDPRPHSPFRFEIQLDHNEIAPGLTTEQVEAHLAEIAALPAADEVGA